MDWISWDERGRPRIDMDLLEAWTVEQARLEEVRNLEDDNADMRQTIHDLEWDNDDKDQTIEDLQQEVADLKRQLDLIYQKT